MAALGSLPKLKGGLVLAFSAHFLHDFSINIFFIYLILHQWTKFQFHIFSPSQDIKQNVLLSSYL